MSSSNSKSTNQFCKKINAPNFEILYYLNNTKKIRGSFIIWSWCIAPKIHVKILMIFYPLGTRVLINDIFINLSVIFFILHQTQIEFVTKWCSWQFSTNCSNQFENLILSYRCMYYQYRNVFLIKIFKNILLLQHSANE